MARSKTNHSHVSVPSSAFQTFKNNTVRPTLLLVVLLVTSLATFHIGTRLDHPPSACNVSLVNTVPTSNPGEPNRAITAVKELKKRGGAEETAVLDEFWRQPDAMGYRPCLEFSDEYRKETEEILGDRWKYLLVVVDGGLNQQTNQIADAVVIARILGAALVTPILLVNRIWGDESEFSDLFDFDHFKRVLADDVRIVAGLPPVHITTAPVVEARTLYQASAQWIRSNYLNKLNTAGVMLLHSIETRLAKDLPPDLQKLRCKVAFEALRFSPRIMELGNKLTTRMRSEGPYLALHLRLEADVWIRTGCPHEMGRHYEELLRQERIRRPKMLTSTNKMPPHVRKRAGLCPLTSNEVARLLKALGLPRNARIYWAGGEPLGGAKALKSLIEEYPFLYNKENISFPGELDPFANRSSVLAAIDFIVSENSDVFMQSHGGNMGRVVKGHRAYAGHKKTIVPKKREMIGYFLNTTMPESEFNEIIRSLHVESIGQPEIRMDKPLRNVIAYPVPECMCNGTKWVA